MTDYHWKKLSDTDKIAHLVKTCNEHRFFSKSEPPFDEKFFRKLMEQYPLDATRLALIEMHKYFGVLEEKAFNRKAWRKTLYNWLRRNKNRQLVSAKLKKPFKKKELCGGCKRFYDPEVWSSPGKGRCYECWMEGR